MIRIRQIKIDVKEYNESVLLNNVAHKLKIKIEDIKSYELLRKSIDARDKNKVLFVLEVNVKVENEKAILKKIFNKDIFLSPSLEYIFPNKGIEKINDIVVVGSGPAGLFTTLILSEAGYKVTLIERGKYIDERIKDVNNFWKNNELNENSNVQFGLGGAGTFSDGKLNTSINDPHNRIRKVLNTFVKFGANKEILYDYKPHIGTDVLVDVVKNMVAYIESLGSKILYNTCLTDLKVEDNKIKGIEINNSDYLKCDALVLAIGHSARDTFYMLNNYLDMKNKPFAVGVRVMHSQEMINESMYGSIYKDYLDNASYKLTYTTKENRGVYSFCMCPGGYVINASSEKKALAINGMSNYKRDSKVANSSIIVTVNENDYGASLFDGVEFQRKLEQDAYLLGKGNIPLQNLKDFYLNKKSDMINNNNLAIKGNYSLTNINECLPKYISDALKEALPYFETKIKGYNNDDTILAAIESRTSSPVKILRDDSLVSNIEGIYPCGEGAGYAGGITSAAVDGIKVAEEIIKKYYTEL